MGGKVLVPTQEAINKLVAARLAADVAGRADRAHRAHRRRRGQPAAVRLRCARRAVPDRRAHERRLLPRRAPASSRPSTAACPTRPTPTWCGARPRKPDLAQARALRRGASTRSSPDKLLAYNCSPSFNWKAQPDAPTMRDFREELAAMGYRFQFITLAGWHALNLSMFELARAYATTACSATRSCSSASSPTRAHGYPRRQAPGLRRHRLLRRRADRDHRRRSSRPAPWPAAPRPSSSRARARAATPRSRAERSRERTGQPRERLRRSADRRRAADAAALIVAHFRGLQRRIPPHHPPRRSGTSCSGEWQLGAARCGGAHRALRAARRSSALRRAASAAGPAHRRRGRYWVRDPAAYGQLIERVPDSEFYRTFFNSHDPRSVRHRRRQPRRGVHAPPELSRACRLGADPRSTRRPARCSRRSATCSPTCRSPRRSATPELARAPRDRRARPLSSRPRPPSAAPESIEISSRCSTAPRAPSWSAA